MSLKSVGPAWARALSCRFCGKKSSLFVPGIGRGATAGRRGEDEMVLHRLLELPSMRESDRKEEEEEEEEDREKKRKNERERERERERGRGRGRGRERERERERTHARY